MKSPLSKEPAKVRLLRMKIANHEKRMAKWLASFDGKVTYEDNYGRELNDELERELAKRV